MARRINEKLRRSRKHQILFNNLEFSAITRYCSKYRIKNKSQFMREAIITAVLKKFDEDHPSLFDDQLKLF